MTYGEIQARLNSLFGNESPATAVANYIDGCIRRSYEQVIRSADQAWWLRRHFAFNTIARVSTTGSTGISSATGGSPVVTMGSGLRLDRRHIGGYLRIGGQQATYLIVDVTTNVTFPGATNNYAIVDPPYSGVAFGTTETAKDAELLQVNYRLPPDFINMYSVKQTSSPIRLWAMEPATLDRWIPDPTLLGQRGVPYVYLIAQGTFLPDFWGTKVINTLQIQDAAMVGTLKFTNGSSFVDEDAYKSGGLAHNLVLSANSTLDAERTARNLLQGRFVRMTGDPRWYRINDVRDTNTGVADSPLRLVLNETFQGTTTSNANFTIDGADAGPWMRLYPVPDTVQQIDCEYHAMPPLLQTTNEELRLPSQLHGVVLDGATYYLLLYMNDSRAQVYQREFQVGLIRTQRAQAPASDRLYRYEAMPRLDRSGATEFVGIFPNQIVTS